MKIRLILLIILALMFTTLPLKGSLSVALTVQEELYDGAHATARTDEPMCMGVPLTDGTGFANVNSFGLTGASAGQFRQLSEWPGGDMKWVKVCGIIPSVSAGSTATVTLTDAGSGNFGGSDLATDNGSTITVATGAATFTIKKANYNVLDIVVIGGTTVVATSASPTRGLILTGPDPTETYPDNVTCPCTTVFSSAYDDNSTASIEENGPVMTVIKATGTHYDVNDEPYMQFTQRLTFWKNKTGVKIVTVLRNANYDTSTTPSPDQPGDTFNTAYKGFHSYEIVVQPNISGTTTYSFDAEGAETDTLTGSDFVYLYQGTSNWMPGIQDVVICGDDSSCGDLYTTDDGFIAKKNSTTVASGSETGVPEGWADITDGSGVGMSIGMYEFAAAWPASLEFTTGGQEARIGLFSSRNAIDVYQPWPVWTTREAYMDFHTSNPSSVRDDFWRKQHPLLARADRTYYNTTEVFPYLLPDPDEEDAFMSGLDETASPAVGASRFCYGGGTTNCSPDRSPDDSGKLGNALAIGFWKAYVWPTGGPLNQEEFRWSDMLRFLGRGQTGRWINSRNFYSFAIDRGMWVHSDGVTSSDSTINGFTWRARPHANEGGAEVDGHGLPIMACEGTASTTNACPGSVNSDKAVTSFALADSIHAHWSGILDYYMLTGDELVKEAVVPVKDFFINQNTYQGVTDPSFGTGFPTRAAGIFLIGASNFSIYLKSIGDTDWEDVLDEAWVSFVHHVKTDTCVAGYPVGCTAITVNTYPSAPDNEPAGVNRKRGVHTSNSFRGTSRCTNAGNPFGIPAFYRAQSSFQASILIEGILSLVRASETDHADYQLAKDLAYGIAQWGMSEAYNDDGLSHWFVGGGTSGSDSLYNGWLFGIQFDDDQLCDFVGATAEAGTTTEIGGVIYNNVTLAAPVQGHWMHLVSQALLTGDLTADQERKMKFGLDWIGSTFSSWPADYGGYQLGHLIAVLTDGPVRTLQDVDFGLTHLGSGNYRLSWVVPEDATAYRIKWSLLDIVDSPTLLDFDPIQFTFGVDPATHDNWFAANITSEPSPAGVGTTQTFDITGTGSTSLDTSNFSVKAYIGGAAPEEPPPANGGLLRLRIRGLNQ